jgi:hypothetical protein
MHLPGLDPGNEIRPEYGLAGAPIYSGRKEYNITGHQGICLSYLS